ncbi:hypothetical protein RclHR1_00740002 [Rhizophagus clarus]|uniref:Uncharacterized protein n=1 Tax=Rhizophagus clarus TaxID=94130 RepID=A0A2Z6SLB1_9GLOM|nr:hypothetical protein RclHR1_00740002 [Rhizophagus clarus]GET02732.1 hypothetical protein GLOIN_2v1807853 [Rhizophagus clarus]
MDNNPNLINNGFNNNLQSQTTDTRVENSNIYYNDTNTPCNHNNGYPMINGGDFSAPYTNAPGNVINSNLSSQSYPTTSSVPHIFSQYIGQNVPYSSPFNSLGMTNSSQINHSETFTFDIPGIKIIVISTFPSMTNSSQTNHSEIHTFDIPGLKVIIITLSFQ